MEQIEKGVCCVKGCNKQSIALGLCVNHWRRNRKYGSPIALKHHSGQFHGLSAEDRFCRQVRKTDGCWYWLGGKDKNGYGVFRGNVSGTVFTRAHRFSYALHTGDLLIDMQACHTCDNPSCVNPAHLFAGTNLTNMQDKIAKGRSRAAAGELNGHAVLAEGQVKAIMKDPRPYTKIAADYNVAATTIGSIKQRVSWTNVDGDVVRNKRGAQPGHTKRAKITPEIVLAIRASDETGVVLAESHGISPQSVVDIRKRRSWKHI